MEDWQSVSDNMVRKLISLNQELHFELKKVRNEINNLKFNLHNGKVQSDQNPGNNPEAKILNTKQEILLDDLKIQELQIERIEKVYTFLEYVALNEARFFSNHTKAGLRRAQAELQRVRLWLYDAMGIKSFKSNTE